MRVDLDITFPKSFSHTEKYKVKSHFSCTLSFPQPHIATGSAAISY